MEEFNEEEVFAFLLRLRDSGAINMWGAATPLAEAFDMPQQVAKEFLMKWIKSF